MFFVQLVDVAVDAKQKPLADWVFGIFPQMPEIPAEADAPILILHNRQVVSEIKAQRYWPTLSGYYGFDPILSQASDQTLYAMFQENHGFQPTW